MKNIFVNILLICIFFGLTALFAVVVFMFVPRNMAVKIIGLAGLVLMTAGPFWAMGLKGMLNKRFLRD